MPPQVLKADIAANDDRGWTFNLAIFRILFLGGAVLPFAWHVFRWAEQVMPSLPREVWVPISFYRNLPFDFLANADFTYWLALINVGFVGLALIGLLTRWTLGLATILSLYLFGLVQNQGKVDHIHHLVWFMALLALGPSGHFLSLDSILDAIRRARRGVVEPVVPRSSALWTFRYLWVLVGLLFLVPGAAKLEKAMSAGWATAGNLRNILWERWFELSLYMPGFEFPLRLDMMPEPVLELSAFAVIFFEIVFILLVLFRPLRPFLALAALAFHFGNGFLLHIWFKALLPAYVCFFDWTAMGRAAGRWIGVTPLLVFYDGSCRLCIRTIAVLRSIDIFEGLEPVDGGSDDPRKLAQRKLTNAMLAHDLYAIDGGRTLQGYEAYRRIASRIPLLWPAVPLMGWAPVAALGRRLYRKIADSRACSVIREPRPVIATDSACRPLFWTGTLLVLLQTGVSGALFAHDLATEYLSEGHRARRSLAGFHSWSPVWPFDQYPTFTWTPKEKTEIWEARAVLSSGREMRISARAYAAAFGTPARCWRAAQGIKREADPDRHRARSLQLARSLWRHEAAAIRESAVSVNIYHSEYSLNPSHRMPVRQRLIHTFPVALISGAEPKFSGGSNISERVRSGR